MSDSVQPHRRQPTRLPRPWDSPVKNTGVGCHFLLQCRKLKSESEVTQSCPTLSDPMDCSLPGSSTHGIFQARVLEWGAIAYCLFLLLSQSQKQQEMGGGAGCVQWEVERGQTRVSQIQESSLQIEIQSFYWQRIQDRNRESGGSTAR